MEAINFKETTVENTSHINGSVDLSFLESLSVHEVLYSGDCFSVYHFQFQNMTLVLYPWAELQRLLSLCSYVVLIRRISLWLSLVIGIPGNILALLTILRFPRSPGTFYLILLAIFDWMALATKAMNVAIVTYNVYESISCKFIFVVTNFTATYANWILVLISFERLVTVLFPLKKNYYFTMRRARLGAVIVAVILFLFNSGYVWIITAGDYGCVAIDEDIFDKWVHASTVIYSYLPSFLLIIILLLIWRALRTIKKNREYIFCGEEGASSVALTQHRLQEQARTERSITMMLLFAAITFVLLTVPLCVMLAVENSNVVKESNLNRVCLELSHTIAQGLATLTHAVNFFIYFVSTKRFRTRFRQLFTCLPFDRRQSSNVRSLNTEEVMCSHTTHPCQ